MRFVISSLSIIACGFSFAPILAAPIPITSSQTFLKSIRGAYFSDLGFTLNPGSTKWVPSRPPKANSYIEALYLPAEDENIQASLTVRSDKMEKKYTLEQFSQRWLKDYPRFGFDVLAAKKVRVGQQIGFMLDLVNHDNAKQLRQVLFVKGNHAVSLTCRDDQKSFSKTIKACNEIIRTFRW